MFHLVFNNNYYTPYRIETLAIAIQGAIDFHLATDVNVDVISCITGEVVFSIGKKTYVAESVVYEI